MERLKNMKNQLMACVEGQLSNLDCVDTHELGEAIDMIKDLEEAMYYCSIVKAMEKAEEEEKLEEKYGITGGRRYFHDCYPIPEDYPYERDMDRHMGRMYYSERQPRNSKGEFISYNRGGRNSRYYGGEDSPNSESMGNNRGMPYNGSRYYTEREIPFDLRDSREGRSPMSRRMYMEAKELHKDKQDKIKDLEHYLKELGEDIVEMIEDASPEEKQILERKMTQLTSKIAQLNV